MDNKMPDIPLDFVTNDYNGYFKLMKDAIPILTPEWTDTSDTDQGIVILQLLAYGLHVLGYQQERIAQENILELARTKRGILHASAFLGYNPSRQTASSVMLKFIVESSNYPRTIFKGTQISTDPSLGTPIVFETMEDLTFDVGETEKSVLATHGISFKGEILANANGEINQVYTIANSDVLIDTLEVYSIEGNVNRTWERVDNFLNSTYNSRHYTLGIDEENRTTVIFGDGTFGMKPPQGVNIFVSYRMGGGKLGNLAPNLLTYKYDREKDLSFVEDVRNEDFAVGGNDYEDMERVRRLAPIHYRSREQAVTLQDFEDLAVLQEGVLKAKAVETKTSTKLYLYLLGDNGLPATTALCQTVKNYVDKKRVGNVDLDVRPCNVANLNIQCTVYVHPSFDTVTVLQQVYDNLKESFDVSNFDFGQPFYASKVIDVAFRTAGVQNVVLQNVNDIVPNESTIIKLVDVSVNGG